MNFIEWLKTQHERDDEIGALARDLRNDPCALYLRDDRDLIWHIGKVHKVLFREEEATPVLRSLSRAHREWEATQ